MALTQESKDRRVHNLEKRVERGEHRVEHLAGKLQAAQDDLATDRAELEYVKGAPVKVERESASSRIVTERADADKEFTEPVGA